MDNELKVKLGADIKDLNNGLDQANKSVKNFSTKSAKDLERLDKAASSLGNKGFKNVGKGAANAVPAVTEFSRVIQDAPFGIQGIANNITQLTQNFGYLKQSAGGTSKALGAMVATLTGPAGILLAVSAVTSILVSYGDEIKEFVFGTDEAALSVEKLNAALKNQSNLINTVVSQNKIAGRIAAKEAKLAGENAQTQFDEEQKWRELTVTQLEATLTEAQKVKDAAAAQARLKANQDNEEIQDGAKDAAKALLSIEKKLSTARLAVLEADLDNRIRIQEQSKEITEQGTRDAIVGLNAYRSQVLPLATQIGDETSQALAPQPDLPTVDYQYLQLLERLRMFGDQAMNIVQGSVAGAFVGIGEAIGTALAEGGNVISSIGGALLDSLSGFLSDMGRLLIEYGTLAVIKGTLDTAIAAGGPVAIAAGIAAIAVGTALSAAGAAIGNRASQGAQGGGSYEPRSSYSSSNYGTANYGSSYGGSQRVVFEIAGTKLVGVLSNTLSRNRSLGGQLGLTI